MENSYKEIKSFVQDAQPTNQPTIQNKVILQLVNTNISEISQHLIFLDGPPSINVIFIVNLVCIRLTWSLFTNVYICNKFCITLLFCQRNLNPIKPS